MEITPELITQFGLIQKVSTGRPYLDMVIVMLVPILIRTIMPWITALVEKYWNAVPKEPEVFTRQIEYKKNYEYYWYDNNDGPSNSVLQKALMNYINKHPEVLRELPTADYQIKKKHVEPKTDMTGQDDEQEGSNADEHLYDVNVLPPIGIWIDLKNGIKFMRQHEALDDKNKNFKTTYFLEATSAGKGIDKIESFVQEALQLYKSQQVVKVDTCRYLYIPVLTGLPIRTGGDDGDAKSPSAVYKRYKLSEEKTFKSFFHPDKDGILQLVRQFCDKTGKFGIPGYPQKLGFLLYGPPGTGKTSFIKALAQYTKRSIISIPLTKIRTNQELMDVMMDQKISVENEDGAIQLPYAKTIFILEDVDAASNVVQRRSPEESPSVSSIAVARMAQAQASMRKKKKKAKKDAASEVKDEIEPAGSDSDKSDDEGKGKKPMKGFGPMPYFGRSIFGGDDELNLAGLLNVLDGVVDTPNRIVIMTTNHPEKLDPALIRPGRINKKVYMGRICVNECLEMMKHYYGTVPADAEAQLRAVFVDEALSPAELEAMCAEYDTATTLVDQLTLKFSLGATALASASMQACP